LREAERACQHAPADAGLSNARSLFAALRVMISSGEDRGGPTSWDEVRACLAPLAFPRSKATKLSAESASVAACSGGGGVDVISGDGSVDPMGLAGESPDSGSLDPMVRSQQPAHSSSEHSQSHEHWTGLLAKEPDFLWQSLQPQEPDLVQRSNSQNAVSSLDLAAGAHAEPSSDSCQQPMSQNLHQGKHSQRAGQAPQRSTGSLSEVLKSQNEALMREAEEMRRHLTTPCSAFLRRPPCGDEEDLDDSDMHPSQDKQEHIHEAGLFRHHDTQLQVSERENVANSKAWTCTSQESMNNGMLLQLNSFADKLAELAWDFEQLEQADRRRLASAAARRAVGLGHDMPKQGTCH